MFRTAAVLAASFVLLAAPGLVTAGDAVGEVYVTPSGVYFDDDKDRGVDDSPAFRSILVMP